MILRRITTEEIAAITLLIQHAENIGSAPWSEAEIHEAIKVVYENTQPERAKDVGFSWMLSLMSKTNQHLQDMFEQQREMFICPKPPETLKEWARKVIAKELKVDYGDADILMHASLKYMEENNLGRADSCTGYRDFKQVVEFAVNDLQTLKAYRKEKPKPKLNRGVPGFAMDGTEVPF